MPRSISRVVPVLPLLAFCVGVGFVTAALLPKGAAAPPAASTPDSAARGKFPSDPLPAGARARFGSLRLQDRSIRDGVFSPDTKLLATTGGYFDVCIWEVDTGKLIRTHEVRGEIEDLRWKPDGKLAVFTSFDHEVFLMQEFGPDEKPDAKEVAKIEEEARNKKKRSDMEKKDRLEYVFLSADCRKVIAICQHPAKPIWRVRLYPFTSGRLSATATAERTIAIPNGEGPCLSGDGKFLLVHLFKTETRPSRLVAYDLTARKDRDKPAWDIILPGGERGEPYTYFFPDGKRVVILFSDETVELWDGPRGKRVRQLPKLPVYRHHGDTEWEDIALTPDGKRLALIYRGPTGERGGRIVDTETGKDICTLAPQPMPKSQGRGTWLSADGKRVAQVGHGVLRIWNAETGADACPLPGHRGPVNSLVAGRDGKTVVSAGDDLTVRAWNPTTGKEKWRTNFPQVVNIRFATPDGVVVQEAWDGQSGPATLVDPDTGKTRPLPGKLGGAKKDVLLAVAPDGKMVVSLEPKKLAFRVWSWPDGELRRTVPRPSPGKAVVIRDAAGSFTPDGKQFVAAMSYGVLDDHNQVKEKFPPFVERWDLGAWKMLDRVENKDHIEPLLFAGAGSVFLLEKAQLRDACSGQTIARLSFAEGEVRNLYSWAAAALSPDLRTLAACEGVGDFREVFLFEMRTGRQRERLAAEGEGPQRGLLFLPDGRLVSAGATALVWDVGLPPAGAAVADKLEKRELADLWATLADENPEKAWPAMTKLVKYSVGVVPFIRKRIRAVPRLSDADLERLFRKLDSTRFKEREAATKELDGLGAVAVSRVKARLGQGVSEEVKRRLWQFLKKYDRPVPPPEELRALRAVEVLEAVGTAEAKEVLAELATGEQTAALTRDAVAAMRRLRQLPTAITPAPEKQR